ncbi:Cation/hydrogen exchanger 15-like protein [Hibiscus syriacus]|uniref:Cation/hydrogen exchanger 15-like protein n=1 Tax=Hibiscus syriacus TaxID=106335 RepID=A0A6A2XQJ1_HIBSY|nr:Cation/hydrogen exchanger 15-like protein [Hibiscus syriacus]
MGACCSMHIKYKGKRRSEYEDDLPENREKSHDTKTGHNGAILRLRGSSPFISMYTRNGHNRINQDAMTVWENSRDLDSVRAVRYRYCMITIPVITAIASVMSAINFTGEKGAFFCGVFDGHGPSGHRVARYACHTLPSKLSLIIEVSQLNGCRENDALVSAGQNDSYGVNKDTFSSWKTSLIKAFKEVDEDLDSEFSLHSYSSGTTAVTIVKQDEHLIVSNLGDSRAVLGSRNNKNRLLPIQLTVDLKPNEAERIEECGGKVFAMDEEPHVLRVWAPGQDCAGLAMTRAFGDFCLKYYGLSSIPEVSYRRLTSRDEFVVLASDGVWDVLTNKEVITIVESVKPQSRAAEVLVDYAVQAWRSRCPGSEVDDCAVICLFLKE